MNNDRIKQLVEEAGFYMTEKNGQSLAKFAELIVRECADVVSGWKSEPFPYDPEFGARLIKEHFGVES